jgi:hypothetical protein
METSFAYDERARVARIEETRALADQITELAGHINAATYRFLSLIAEFDRRSGWSDGATQSCAHWLNWKSGISLGAALEDGAVRFVRATGESFDSVAPDHSQQMCSSMHTAVTRWDGGPMDFSMGVEALLRRRRDANSPSYVTATA